MDEELTEEDVLAFMNILEDLSSIDENSLDDGDVSEESAAMAKDIITGLFLIINAMNECGYGQCMADDYDRLILSDMCSKSIKDLANSKKPLSDRDIKFLMYMMGDDGFDTSKADEWDDSMIEKYADHLRNYLYTYREEATEIDPSIDPNEEHVGPMAQDIEKVAPDCVKETPEGVKEVDGNRLALVNAGVIGDLSREILELKEKIRVLEASR